MDKIAETQEGVRDVVFVGFEMYNKFCIYRGKLWKYQMRKIDIIICE